MKWPRKKATVDLCKTGAAVAARAAEQAEERLSETRALWPEILTLAHRLSEIREHNHLAEIIRESILGGEE